MPKISALGGMSSRGFGEFAQQSSGAYIEDVFSTYLYDGTDAPQTISNGIDLSGNGGLVWLKSRAGTVVTGYDKHILFDTVRTNTNSLTTNSSAAVESGWSDSFFRFRSNGFDFGTSTSTTDQSYLNNLGVSYVSWTFRGKTKFFDVVSYTGNGANRTIAHNLGSVPGMIIIKRRNASSNWAVYHRSLANTEYLGINTTAAANTDATYWNSTTPTATEFSLGTSGVVNTSGGTYIAYLFAHDAGGFGANGTDNAVSCGSVTTNAGGTATVNLGWEPQFILFKSTSAGTNWFIWDTIRGLPVGASDAVLYPNAVNAESQPGNNIDLTATGFNLIAAASQTYIYMAIRRGPMKVPTDGTTVFQPTVYTGTNVNNRLVNTTIAPDMAWIRQRNSTTVAGMVVGDRLRGQPYLLTGSYAAEVTSATALDQQIVSATEYGTAFSSMNGVWVGTDATAQLNVSTTASNQIIEAFKRAPGFFDAVAYTGSGVARTISHNLAVVPEIIIIRSRTSNNWVLYTAPTGLDNYLVFNSDSGSLSGGSLELWNNTLPTSSVFSLGTNSVVNGSGVNTMAYLFASCPGVSKVGSYTGTGTTQQINCGFTSGARFVLIKRTDTTGDWYVYDTARGIVAGNDPYLLLNSTAAEDTSTDYVDAYSAGFELSSTAPAGLNQASGITWIARTSGFSGTIYDLAYGNGLFVAVGAGGQLTTSSDGGVTWTARTSSFGATNIYTVTYGNGTFVAAGDSGKLATSPDGITWTQRTSGFGSSLIDGSGYGNGLFVIVGLGGLLSTSPDGITWTSRTSSFGASNINCVEYGNGLYVAGGDGKIATSTDGITWTQRTSPFSGVVTDIAYGNNLYVAVSSFPNNIATSSDGISWTLRTSGVAQNFSFAAYGNGTYMAGGGNGSVVTSTDGITWVDRTAGVGFGAVIETATYRNGTFVIGGRLSKISTNSPSYIYLAIA